MLSGVTLACHGSGTTKREPSLDFKCCLNKELPLKDV
jgi:hypothetical protein